MTRCTPSVGPEALPLVLAELHGRLEVGAPLDLRVRDWDPQALGDVVRGGGFSVDACRSDRRGEQQVQGTRLRTLPDYVGPGLRLLVVGLNPSEFAADAGVGFARPGNRFWPAALAAGVVSRDRDPWHAVRVDRLGMTDLVKRATPRAAELTAAEYRDGLVRVERLIGWLRPRAVVFAGLAGWRAAVDRRAVAGEQSRTLGAVPVYVMPNPSGLNAHDTVASLADHLRSALRLATTSR